MKQIAIMMSIPDSARADVMLTADRIYYRFITDDTMEDGDLPGLKDRYTAVEARLKGALQPLDGETPAQDVKISIFVDNVKKDTSTVSAAAIHRLAEQLIDIDDVFSFLFYFATASE